MPHTTQLLPLESFSVSAGQLGVVLDPLVTADAPTCPVPATAASPFDLAPVPTYPLIPVLVALVNVPLAAGVETYSTLDVSRIELDVPDLVVIEVQPLGLAGAVVLPLLAANASST